MPLFFIHGVNVRKEDADYEKEAKQRGKLFRDVVLKPLVTFGSRFEKMVVHDIYWGDLGVSFGWKLASVPKVKTLQSFGPDELAAPSDLLLAETLESIAASGAGQADDGVSEPSGSPLKRAAAQDPLRFAEALLLPVLVSDFELIEESSAEEGELEALLSRSTADAASDLAVQADMKAAGTDDELIETLTIAIEKRFRTLAKEPAESVGSKVESYGSERADELRPRIRELFGRALHLPSRAVSLSALQVFRSGFHRKFSRFLGDVFVYLQRRGDPTHPGPIAERVISELKATPGQHPDEPKIVVTHSMGGNILYDILTSFSPDLFIDVWISVGGQVAQFEEMKLFLASDKNIVAPARVDGIKQRVGYWLNVYDPADSFSFMASPVFTGVDADLPFSTGTSALKSHTEYFGLASFHQLLREHILKGLKLG